MKFCKYSANITFKNQQNPELYLFINNKAHAFHGHLMTDPALLGALHQSLSK